MAARGDVASAARRSGLLQPVVTPQAGFSFTVGKTTFQSSLIKTRRRVRLRRARFLETSNTARLKESVVSQLHRYLIIRQVR